MKQILTIVLFLIVFVSVVNSQKTDEKRNISGMFELDDSYTAWYLKGHEVGESPRIRETKACRSKLEIEHDEPKLTIKSIPCNRTGTRLPEQVRTYYTDGRGEFNNQSDGARQETKTQWDQGNNLSITYYFEKNGKTKRFMVATFKITKDGEKLTEKVFSDPDDTESYYFYSYNRVK